MYWLLVQHAHTPEQARQQTQFSLNGRRLVNAGFSIEGAEQSKRIVGALGRAQHQKSVWVERIVKSVARQILQFAIQVNQEIAAGDEIDARERRVLEQAVASEQHQVAQLLANTIMICFSHEKTPQTFFADVSFDGRGIPALSRDGERPGVYIRAKDLNCRPPDVLT